MPPSSFANSQLRPVASKDLKESRRISRTDLDFEQALRQSGTVKLKESLDVNTLGVSDNSASSAHEFTSPASRDARTPRTHAHAHALPTPVVVPPTPSPPCPGPSSARCPSSTSSSDVFYDAEDTEIQTKRRSLYRSPGTSSSPDLSVLARKTKERGGVLSRATQQQLQMQQMMMEKRAAEQPPPLPVNSHSQTSPAKLRPPVQRPRSSTSAGASSSSSSRAQQPPPPLQITPVSSRPSKLGGAGTGRDPSSPSTSEWVMTSPRSRSGSTAKCSSDKVRFPDHLSVY